MSKKIKELIVTEQQFEKFVLKQLVKEESESIKSFLKEGMSFETLKSSILTENVTKKFAKRVMPKDRKFFIKGFDRDEVKMVDRHADHDYVLIEIEITLFGNPPQNTASKIAQALQPIITDNSVTKPTKRLTVAKTKYGDITEVGYQLTIHAPMNIKVNQA